MLGAGPRHPGGPTGQVRKRWLSSSVERARGTHAPSSVRLTHLFNTAVPVNPTRQEVQLMSSSMTSVEVGIGTAHIRGFPAVCVQPNARTLSRQTFTPVNTPNLKPGASAGVSFMLYARRYVVLS